ncbi:NADAR family protein [Umezawaea sp. Da 62-37]|uniref:NADAR family protein n=1 Tax=Umezawaea sp. Da 62-37 TaxID=3075927 RepID=UPI0028F71E06|nr:NADAR family protein [Umezawaea sp. Da 62-37]WNV86525.1 NADAR family protein [Umezawaea sp. Da 62-37]
MIRDLDAARRAEHRGVPMEFVHFWGHESRGGLGVECLSQWYPSPFTVDGVTYATAEHYMMAGKARLFGDERAEQRVLAAHTPFEAKNIGRQVRGFDSDVWDDRRVGIVVDGNIGKFTAHPEMRGFLLGTGDRVLVEASPLDRVWGIGLGSGDGRAATPSTWRGLNLLGFALMTVRERLTT